MWFNVNHKIHRTMLRLLILAGFVLVCLSEVNIHPRVHIEPDYNIHEAPVRKDGKPIDVNFTINLRNILEVNEVAQLISLETSIRLFWKDFRVRADMPKHNATHNKTYMTLNPKAAQYFWIPDIFIDRSKMLRVPTFYVKPASLRIYHDQTLRYSSRVNFDVACTMDFHKFPVDEQLCEINLESFGHTNEQLKFQWVEGSNFNHNITLAQFTWEVLLKDSYSTGYYDLSYPGVILKIRLQRQIGYHITQTYIPSFLFVALSWLSLFVSPDSIPGRVGMGMTTLLTLTAMFGSTRGSVPRVSYSSYLDIWMVTCIIFVFASLIEFTIVHSFYRNNHKNTGDCLEKFMQVAIPVVFLVFNTFYWHQLYVAYNESVWTSDGSLKPT